MENKVIVFKEKVFRIPESRLWMFNKGSPEYQYVIKEHLGSTEDLFNSIVNFLQDGRIENDRTLIKTIINVFKDWNCNDGAFIAIRQVIMNAIRQGVIFRNGKPYYVNTNMMRSNSRVFDEMYENCLEICINDNCSDEAFVEFLNVMHQQIAYPTSKLMFEVAVLCNKWQCDILEHFSNDNSPKFIIDSILSNQTEDDFSFSIFKDTIIGSFSAFIRTEGFFSMNSNFILELLYSLPNSMNPDDFKIVASGLLSKSKLMIPFLSIIKTEAFRSEEDFLEIMQNLFIDSPNNIFVNAFQYYKSNFDKIFSNLQDQTKQIDELLNQNSVLQAKSKQIDELLNQNSVLQKEIDQLKLKDQEFIRNLIKNINPSDSDITIWKAAETGKISILLKLLLNGTDINARDSDVIHYLL